MSYYCYIIYSSSLDSYYVGETEGFQERILCFRKKSMMVNRGK